MSSRSRRILELAKEKSSQKSQKSYNNEIRENQNQCTIIEYFQVDANGVCNVINEDGMELVENLEEANKTISEQAISIPTDELPRETSQEEMGQIIIIEKENAIELMFEENETMGALTYQELLSEEKRSEEILGNEDPNEKDELIISAQNPSINEEEVTADYSQEKNHPEEELQEDIAAELMIEEKQIKKRAKKHKIDQTEWQINMNKKRREKGLAYEGKVKTEGTWKYNIKKPARLLSAPCQCSWGKKPYVVKCSTVTEESRRKIFDYFWTLSWPEKQIYIRDLAKLEKVKRRRGTEENSKRDYTIKYYLKLKSEYVRVCKKMFLGTLGMKETVILNWLKKSLNIEDVPILNRSQRVSEERRKKFRESQKRLQEFFNDMPKMESHYCRASSSKLYLEAIWHSKSDLYKFYKTDFCPQNNLTPVSITTFFKIYEEMNLAIYRPKKDLCDICVGHQTKNLSDEMYQLHQQLKEEARAEKQRDKDSEKGFVFTMDLQSVLLSPKSTVSAMYYKQKLIVHNFTLYNIKNGDAFCYLWNETEGAVTANEFATIIVYFIETEILPKMQEREDNIIILYSDGCTGQNRNSTLSNSLLNLCMIHNITVIQKYLQKGHTQMEVDSMHATIERKLKNRNINVPADYMHVCRTARKNPSPYHVKYLTHDFFKNLESLKFYQSIRPGRSVGDPTVTDIKALKYLNDGEIQYKIRHTEEWRLLNQRKKALSPQMFNDIPNLYKERRKIKKEKFQHLQILKKTLDVDYHQFYDTIPYDCE